MKAEIYKAKNAENCQQATGSVRAMGSVLPRSLHITRSKPVDAFIPGFWPPGQGDNKFLLLKPPSLGYFVMAAPGN